MLAAAGLAVAVSAGTAATAAAASPPAHDPGAFGFGNNDYGQLGHGTSVDDRELGHVIGLPASVTQLAAGGNASAALLPDGTVWTWGESYPDGSSRSPAPVSGLTGITQIAVSQDGNAFFAVGAGGRVWAWGRNFYGQLGDGSTVDHLAPAPVPGLDGVTQVSAGPFDTVALRSDGTVWAWGANDYGELGDGTTGDHFSPRQVRGLSGVTQVSAGADYTVAVRSDGTVSEWGLSGNGELNGSAGKQAHLTPEQVPGLSGITQVATDGFHTLALRSDGAVWSWGENSYGEIGDGSFTARTSPEQLSLSGVIRVAVGPAESAAVRSDGTLLTWGDNSLGGLDLPCCYTDSPTPTPAAGLTWVTQAAFGYDYGLALSAVPAGMVAVPGVTGKTQAQATQALRAAGLFLGSVTARADLSCDNIGLVLSQRPAAGDYASRGTSVSITIGKLPPKCF